MELTNPLNLLDKDAIVEACFRRVVEQLSILGRDAIKVLGSIATSTVKQCV